MWGGGLLMLGRRSAGLAPRPLCEMLGTRSRGGRVPPGARLAGNRVLRKVCRSGKGFGNPSSPSSVPRKKRAKGEKQRGKKNSTAEQAALDALQTGKGPKGVRPVDIEEASKGRLDFVQVKDWGTGMPDDVGKLEVKSFKPVVQESDLQPFYERLARKLETLQTQGALNIAQQKPMPPFEKWSFGEHRYCSYICDQQHVHNALETAVETCTKHSAVVRKDDTTRKEAQTESALTMLHQLLETEGLARSQQFGQDLAAMMATQDTECGAQLPSPSPEAVAYARYLQQLSRTATLDEEDEEGESDRTLCRLMANGYTIMITHLTTGFRIGARATEELGLLTRGATNAFQSYPESTGNPLETFVEGMNRIGPTLTTEQQEHMFEELAPAFTKTALLFVALAHED
ncbi:unnamed protein product [Ostreobium quekettii]|uniref:heme oxygenase (biliverdin-producing) n=1 Tax=Ostreobium quekettii TaxID=121088 RepID=A0A8S1J4P9_9CHLO|nr:unnamed protein product [Ostreobium quekettii]|eukprot:evm.model.scf_1301EXC.4 EVM.evm.TU.scf_1301EXC.4   scf_1301EXC:28590-33657(+)